MEKFLKIEIEKCSENCNNAMISSIVNVITKCFSVQNTTINGEQLKDIFIDIWQNNSLFKLTMPESFSSIANIIIKELKTHNFKTQLMYASLHEIPLLK